MHRTPLINDEIYHVYNRGVEKREIFSTEKDYLRFIHCLFEFNDIAPTINTNYYLSKPKGKTIEVRLRYIKIERKPRTLLVEILAFCLMPNHFHLLLRQKKDEGITKFMRKLGTGYTNYFNKKYERVGPLFQGKFKSIFVEDDMYFQYLPHYIHCNALDLIAPEWRDQNLNDATKAIQFLESYRWSSYLDYIGKKNFPSITQRDFILEIFGGSERYKKDTIKLLTEMQTKLDTISPIFLE